MTVAKRKIYKMLQLYSKDIYAHTRYDEKGKGANSSFNIPLNDKKKTKELVKKYVNMILSIDATFDSEWTLLKKFDTYKLS